MDVSLLTSVRDRLVPGSVAMTPAALKHAQSKHSRVGSEGVILQGVCSMLAAAPPLLRAMGGWAQPQRQSPAGSQAARDLFQQHCRALRAMSSTGWTWHC